MFRNSEGSREARDVQACRKCDNVSKVPDCGHPDTVEDVVALGWDVRPTMDPRAQDGWCSRGTPLVSLSATPVSGYNSNRLRSWVVSQQPEAIRLESYNCRDRYKRRISSSGKIC